MITDLESQKNLYEENADAIVPIASLTKLMTAHIILEENSPSEIVKVSEKAAASFGSSMGLAAGEEISVRNLLFGLLVRSGNDSAIALAEHSSGSVEAFVEKMNQKAIELGLRSTIYKNPTGLDSLGAHSSAEDLLILSRHLLKDPDFKEIVSTKEITVQDKNGVYSHSLTNTNTLLGNSGIVGVKTGRTLAAGECLVTLSKTEDGKEVLIVVLGSENRFHDTQILLDWTHNKFTW